MMNEPKMDLRMRRTRKLLWEALMSLLEDHRLEQLTVQDICDRAMVHRTTFYKHYQDKYDLLEQGGQLLFDELSANLVSPSATLAEIMQGEVPDEIVAVFAHAAENRRFYKEVLLGEGAVGPFRKMFNEYLVNLMLQRMRTLTSAREIPDGLIAQFTAGVFITSLSWWLQEGLPCSPHQIAHYAMQLTVNGDSLALGLKSAKETVERKPRSAVRKS